MIPSEKMKGLLLQDYYFHGTIFYQARSLSKTGVHLDLTKKRFALHQKGSDLVKSKESVIYVFVDMNSRLKIKIENNKESFFHQLVNWLI